MAPLAQPARVGSLVKQNTPAIQLPCIVTQPGAPVGLWVPPSESKLAGFRKMDCLDIIRYGPMACAAFQFQTPLSKFKPIFVPWTLPPKVPFKDQGTRASGPKNKDRRPSPGQLQKLDLFQDAIDHLFHRIPCTMLPLHYQVESQAPTEDNANCKFLYDNKASRFRVGPPEYNAITPVITDSYIDEFWLAQAQTFSVMAPVGLTRDQLASLFHVVNTDDAFANLFENISNEANAQFPTDFEASLLPQRAAYRASATRVDFVFLVKKTTTMLGLVSSHDKDTVVPQSVLEVQEEALGQILRHLHRLRYALSHSAVSRSSAFVCHLAHGQNATLFLVY